MLIDVYDSFASVCEIFRSKYIFFKDVEDNLVFILESSHIRGAESK